MCISWLSACEPQEGKKLSNWWKHPALVAIIVDCFNRSRVRESVAMVVSAVPNSGLGRLPFMAGRSCRASTDSECKSHRGGIYNSRLNHGKDPMKKILFALMLVLFAVPGALFAGDILREVKELEIVKNLFPPQMEVIEARDLGSLFELVVKDPSRGNQIFYVTKDGAYLIAGGNLITKDKVNITQQRHEEVNRVDVSKLPLKDAVAIKKGNGAKKLIMFNDVDCPFCRKAYDWLKSQDNYTLYMFFFPLDMHPKSPEKSVQILCSTNQQTDLENAQSDKEISSQKCEAGEKMLARHKVVAGEIGVDGTPLFVTDTGARISGLQIPALESYLKN
jgi:thiol:disulfide interchange protein DsbC